MSPSGGRTAGSQALMAIRVVAKNASVAISAHGHTPESHAMFLLQGEMVGDTSLVATAAAESEDQVTRGAG